MAGVKLEPRLLSGLRQDLTRVLCGMRTSFGGLEDCLGLMKLIGMNRIKTFQNTVFKISGRTYQEALDCFMGTQGDAVWNAVFIVTTRVVYRENDFTI